VSSKDVEKRPVWDEALAKKLPGKRVLVGLTYFGTDGLLITQQEFFGLVQTVDQQRGILLKLEGQRTGEQYNLPPDMRGIFQASPGQYKLRTTGEMVTDPDFTATFSFRQQVDG
jgi:hypothetical protein